MRQTVGIASQSITSPESSETAPTVALTAAAAAVATKIAPTPRTTGERRFISDEAPQQHHRQNHLEHVPAGLAERGADG